MAQHNKSNFDANGNQYSSADQELHTKIIAKLNEMIGNLNHYLSSSSNRKKIATNESHRRDNIETLINSAYLIAVERDKRIDMIGSAHNILHRNDSKAFGSIPAQDVIPLSPIFELELQDKLNQMQGVFGTGFKLGRKSELRDAIKPLLNEISELQKTLSTNVAQRQTTLEDQKAQATSETLNQFDEMKQSFQTEKRNASIVREPLLPPNPDRSYFIGVKCNHSSFQPMDIIGNPNVTIEQIGNDFDKVQNIMGRVPGQRMQYIIEVQATSDAKFSIEDSSRDYSKLDLTNLVDRIKSISPTNASLKKDSNAAKILTTYQGKQLVEVEAQDLSQRNTPRMGR